jgi:hypothetical protein
MLTQASKNSNVSRCSVEGCPKPPRARGRCDTHRKQYERWTKLYNGREFEPDSRPVGRPKLSGKSIWKLRTPSGKLTNGTVKGGFPFDESRALIQHSDLGREYGFEPHQYSDFTQQTYQAGQATGGQVSTDDYNAENGFGQMRTETRYVHDARCHLGKVRPGSTASFYRPTKRSKHYEWKPPRPIPTQSFGKCAQVIETYVGSETEGGSWEWGKTIPTFKSETNCHSARYYRPSRFGDPADRRTSLTCAMRS